MSLALSQSLSKASPVVYILSFHTNANFNPTIWFHRTSAITSKLILMLANCDSNFPLYRSYHRRVRWCEFSLWGTTFVNDKCNQISFIRLLILNLSINSFQLPGFNSNNSDLWLWSIVMLWNNWNILKNCPSLQRKVSSSKTLSKLTEYATKSLHCHPNPHTYKCGDGSMDSLPETGIMIILPFWTLSSSWPVATNGCFTRNISKILCIGVNSIVA